MPKIVFTTSFSIVAVAIVILISIFGTEYLTADVMRRVGYIIAIAFVGMGSYALSSGRVYGRTWQKYTGGWIYRNENPVTYYAYTWMYIIGGLIILIGCRLIFIV